MKTKIFCLLVLFLPFTGSVFSQTKTGTLKVFSDIQTITVFVDNVKVESYAEVNLLIGTHYVKVVDGDVKLYGQIVTINLDQITSVLVEPPKDNVAAVQKPDDVKPTEQTGTGTVNIFSEFTGISIYLNEHKQGDDIKTINNVTAGNHYLKVMKDGVSIFAELITVNPGQTTTVLVKNSEQVAEKIMEAKTPERQNYQNNKIDVLLTSNAVSTTVKKSNYYPGFYGYYGYNKSNTSTVNVSDFKIIKGGVAEISDIDLATLARNQNILSRNIRDITRQKRQVNIGSIGFLGSMAIGIPIIVDIFHKSTPDRPGGFLHPNTSVTPNWEFAVLGTCIVTGIISYALVINSGKHKPRHYYTPSGANTDAQTVNHKLKLKLGLSESYDVR